MIANAKGGSSFKGAAAYASSKDGAEFICSNVGGVSVAQDARMMSSIAGHGRCEKPVLHVSLSLAPGEKLGNEQWEKVALRYKELMGLKESHQHLVFKHTDSECEHIHLILNKVDTIDSKVFSTYKLYEKQTKAMRIIEKEFSLTPINEHYNLLNNGKFAAMRYKIDSALQNSGGHDYEKFKEELSGYGVAIIENKSPTTGRVSGVSYQEIGQSKFYKGSAVGKEYGVNGLQARGLSINPVSHLPTSSYPHPPVSPSFNWTGEVSHGHHGRGSMTIEDMRRSRKLKEKAQERRQI